MWNDNDKITRIFNKTNEGVIKFPCECPICQNHSAHIYIHRHDSKHCGIWTWCNKCGASSHMSGETPAWWANPDFIDASQLCSDPSYLDGMADKIDEWVNSLVSTKTTKEASPFVMENSFNVVLKEDVQGIPAGTAGIIVVRDDFKTTQVDFVDANGKTVHINEEPEKLTQIIKVVGSSS